MSDIDDAVQAERQRIVAYLNGLASRIVERAEAEPLTLEYDLSYRQAAHNAAAEIRDAALLVAEGRISR